MLHLWHPLRYIPPFLLLPIPSMKGSSLMTLSRAKAWLTTGFSLVIISLLYNALAARQAVLGQARSTNLSMAIEEESEAVEEFRFALSAAQASQQQYLRSPQSELFKSHTQQLRLISAFQEELKLEAQFINAENPEYDTALQQLLEEIIAHIENLEESTEKSLLEALPEREQATITQKTQESQADIENALDAFLNVNITEEEIELFPDIQIEANNKLLRISFGTGIGILAASSLYIGLIRFLGQQAQRVRSLQQESQALSQSLESKNTKLETISSSLQNELSRREQIETTYKEIEEAKELSELKLNFFSLASHELRTPLSAILVSAQLLDNANASCSEEKRSRNLKRIQSSAKTMTQLLADILLLTRAEAGKVEFSPQRIELLSFCQSLVNEVKFNAQARQQIVVQQQGQYDVAYLDNKLLRAMLMSLLTNSIKYSPPESQIQLTIVGEVSQVCFQIQDQGIGIPLADQKHLFESFRRGNNVEKTPGTGLGLAVVKKCLDLHGGSIELESEVGLGSTFFIKLPWQQPEQQSSAA